MGRPPAWGRNFGQFVGGEKKKGNLLGILNMTSDVQQHLKFVTHACLTFYAVSDIRI